VLTPPPPGSHDAVAAGGDPSSARITLIADSTIEKEAREADKGGELVGDACMVLQDFGVPQLTPAPLVID